MSQLVPSGPRVGTTKKKGEWYGMGQSVTSNYNGFRESLGGDRKVRVTMWESIDNEPYQKTDKKMGIKTRGGKGCKRCNVSLLERCYISTVQ